LSFQKGLNDPKHFCDFVDRWGQQFRNVFVFFCGFYCSIVALVHKGNNFEIVFPFCFDFVDVWGFDA
jgi:hypothetical protein